MGEQHGYTADRAQQGAEGRLGLWALGLNTLMGSPRYRQLLLGALLMVALFFTYSISPGWAFDWGQAVGPASSHGAGIAAAAPRSSAAIGLECGDAIALASGPCQDASWVPAYDVGGNEQAAPEADRMALSREQSTAAEDAPSQALVGRADEQVFAAQSAATAAPSASPDPASSTLQAPAASEEPAPHAAPRRGVDEAAAEAAQTTAPVIAETPPASPPPALRITLSTLETNMFQAINQRRAAAGLPPLEIDPILTAAARERSQDMVAKGYFSHTAPDGSSFINVLANHGIVTGTVGEILGRNNASDDLSATMVADAFMKSPSHQLHVVYPTYQWVGIGAVKASDNMKYFAVIFRGP